MSKIDLFERAMAVDAGEPVEATLLGTDITLRRMFTGQEVHDIIAAHFDYPDESLRDQVDRIIRMVSNSSDEVVTNFVAKLMGMRVIEVQAVINTIGKICGYKDEGGDFLRK